MAQTVKNLPAMWEIQVQSLGWEDPLEKEMATQPTSVFFPGEFMDRGPWWATVHGVTKSQSHIYISHIYIYIYACTHTYIYPMESKGMKY